MSHKQTPIWKQDTHLISIVTPVKRRNFFRQGILSGIALLGASSIIVLYLLIPMALLLAPLHDWLAQLIGGACILVFIEGLIGITLLKIAQSIYVHRAGHLSLAMQPIDYETTVYLPLLGPQDLLDQDQPTQYLPANWWNDSFTQKQSWQRSSHEA